MIDAETLAEAYFVLSLKPGDQMDKVNARWKRLAMVWHPDRFPSEHGKKDAEEELKKINDAKDKLNKHFASEHKASGPCACNPTGAKPKQQERSGTGQGPGPGKRRTTQENSYEEAEARHRNEERAKRNAEQDAEKAKQAAATTEAAKAQAAVKTAVEQSRQADDERLRWKISIGIMVAWVALNFFGYASMSAKGWWKDFSWKWERDHPSAPAPSQTTTQPVNDYSSNDSAWQQQQQEAAQKRRDEDAEKLKQQKIYEARMAVDRYQKTIDHCTNEIAKIDQQLADPNVSDYDKRGSLSFQNQQRHYLSEAQENLKMAQQDLANLTGVAAPSETPVILPNFAAPTPPPQSAMPYTTTPNLSIPDASGKSPNSFLNSIPAFSRKTPNLFERSAQPDQLGR